MSPAAVVIGAGVSGLAAAAALRRHVDRVLVLERDPAAGPRRGVAQAEQLHNLLHCAQLHLERVLPGFGAALRARGAAVADVAAQTHVWEMGVRMPLRSVGLQIASAGWSAIEGAARDVLPDGVEVRYATGVSGLLVEDRRVTGVMTTGDERIRADVVVDATGTRSQLPNWLAAIEDAAPLLQATTVDRWYVTVALQRPASYVEAPDFWLAFAAPPSSRGFLVSPATESTWRVSASGGRDAEPPSDLATLRKHAIQVAGEPLARLLDGATALGRPRLFRKPVVRWHRYDLLAQPLDGLWPVGDAIASLNPLLGQGISVAAWQASLLAESMPADAGAHHERAAGPVRSALALATFLDEPVFDGAGRTVDPEAYFTALAQVVVDDERLHADYVRMWHLTLPLDGFRRPEMVDKVLAASSTGPAERKPQA